MNCESAINLLDGYIDGELDLVNQLEVEKHVEDCEECGALFKRARSLSGALSDDTFYYRAPDDLREKVRTSIRPTADEPSKASWWKWKWMPALVTTAIAAAAIVVIVAIIRPATSNDDKLASEIVSAHVRSMMLEDHLMDVPSSDQHTVKPWFDGKLDFAPPVIDLDGQGFKLLGGRLDYAAGRAVAALVYQRRQHKINLFIFPSGSSSQTANSIFVKQGYNVIHWERSGMAFWAVSDLNMNEMQEFAQELQK